MSIHRHTYQDAAAAAQACARHIFGLLEETLSGEGNATLAVSGGSTPQLLFDAMAKQRFDWSHVHLFWVDERAVPAMNSTAPTRSGASTAHCSACMAPMLPPPTANRRLIPR